MVSYAVSDKGRVRKINEDFYYNDPKGIGLYIVADGMGGHKAGEVASRLAVEKLSEYISSPVLEKTPTHEEIDDLLRDAVVATNQAVFNLAVSDEELKGMGTTIVVALFRSGFVHIAHIGDSRAYLYRGALRQITKDHSFVQELLSKGRITEAEAVDHPRKNILTRALGTDPSVVVDTCTHALMPGDRLMLCTDGITNHVDANELERFLHNHSPEEACLKMTALANDRGGFDNMTVIIIDNTPEQEVRTW